MEVALIGIDGLEPTLVAEWEDDLPVLSSLIDSGTMGRLRSSDPPLSVPAWPTLYTGKQGGKHGVYGFTRRKPDSYEHVPVNYSDVSAESLWEVLDSEGVSCGVANVPLTYPPSDLDNGYVISGWPVPNRADVCSDPAVLIEIERTLGADYEVNPFPLTLEFDELDDEELQSAISDGLWHHQRAFEALIEQTSVDLFFCVFMAIDIASHNFAWDRDHLRELYVEQDRALGELLEAIPDDTDKIVVSDHGHAAKGSRSFHLNEWLSREGYLRLADSDSESLLERVGMTQKNYVRLKNVLPVGNVHELLPHAVYDRLKAVVPRGEDDSDFDADRIDWSETDAYSSLQNQLFLNTRDDHPAGTVTDETADELREELRERLTEIPHPADERDRLLTAVATRDELFEGPFVSEGPDLVFIADEMRCNAPVGFNGGDVISDERWGEHRQYGVLLTEGPSFAAVDTGIEDESVTDDIDESTEDIKDVFPLVLALFDAAIPENVDGSVPEERFISPPDPTFRASRDDHATAAEYTESEADEVREQLEGLGYLE